MTFVQLLFRNLLFHRRAHLAVLLGVAVGCAVLTGALLVGDSLRGSLRERADAQRCGVEYAMVSPKFFAPLPEELRRVAVSGILLRGSVRTDNDSNPRTLQNITILAGLDPDETASIGHSPSSRLAPWPWSLLPWIDTDSEPSTRWRIIPYDDMTLIPDFLARELGVKVGDRVRVRFLIGSSLPRESLLGQRDADRFQVEVVTRIGQVVKDHDPVGRFQLAPGARAPRNIYIPANLVRDRIARRKDECNAVIARGVSRATLQSAMREHLSLNDWGVSVAPHSNYVAVESRQTLLEAAVVAGVERAAAGLPQQPTLVYLANSIAAAGREAIPYSVIAALDLAAKPPLGSFLPPGVESLNDDEIVLVDWVDSPLRGLPAGTPLTVTYFEPETKDGRLVETQTTFKLRGYIPLAGVAADPSLTPAYPGVTDKLSLRDWDPPFPYDNKKLKPRDEKFWREHKATPKAYITLPAGRKLWASRFGDTTSIRVANVADLDDFKERLRSNLNPEDGGFVFDDVKARFDAASRGGQDFGGLFLGFSFFLIAAALLLVGLLTRLNLERRAAEIGLLLATGWRVAKVRQLLLLEGVAVAAVGGLVGLAGAVGYAWAMLRLLAWLWPDAAVGSFLKLHVGAESLAIGFSATLAISAGAILWALRLVKRASPSALLAGAGNITNSGPSSTRRRGWMVVLGAIAAIVGIGALAGGAYLPDPEARAGSFFGGGFFLLTAALTAIWLWLKRESAATFTRPGRFALLRLGASNAKRYPARSLLTAGLLASAAFLLVAVESFRRRPERDFAQRGGGSGGFAFIVETDQPVFRDLNSDGRTDLLDALRIGYQASPDSSLSVEQRIEQARAMLAKTDLYPFRLRAGDDASCQNLYQANRPRLLGVPARLAAEPSRFRFAQSEARTPEEKANPWLLLQKSRDDGAVPVFGEANTLQWMLKKGLGDEIEVPDERGRPVKLHIAGILQDSVFASELLLSATAFQRIYPRQEGYPYFLVETDSPAVADLLRAGLAKQGAEVTPTGDRVAAYLAIENTYLTTFQLLGGLGLLLGASGLAVVLLRGVWERRGELALLRALGYRNRALSGLVLAENGLLLVLGLAAGVGTALLSVLPHIAAGGSIPWLRLMLLLALVVLAGLGAGLWAVRATLRAPLLPALRRE